MISIGTCGYCYDDWRGVFYPEGTAKREFLAWYVMHFRCLELNSSYYAIPSRALVRNLTEHTPDKFQVAVKAYHGITHQRNLDPESDLERLLDAIRPLGESGKLACVLLQFPYSFHYGESQMDFLARLIERVQPIVPVVEFRNAQWMKPEVWQWLWGLEASICCVDEPEIEGLMPRETVMSSPRAGYVRFHGRNAARWCDHEDAAERYDYLYPESELREWVKGIRWLEEQCDRTFVMFNNHPNGQAVRNARMMEHLLGLGPPPGAESQQRLL